MSAISFWSWKVDSGVPIAVEQLLYLMDLTFDEADQEHSLLGNLRSVPTDGWRWVPPGGSRTVRQIVGHVGACKYMYDNYAFGDGRMTWDEPAVALGCTMEELQSSPSIMDEPSPEHIIAWLNVGHRRLRQHVSVLDDDDLSKPRRRPEGEMKETRWIIALMIGHDLYHCRGDQSRARADAGKGWLGVDSGVTTRRSSGNPGQGNSDGIFPEGSIRVSAPLNSRPRTVRIALDPSVSFMKT